MPLLSRKREPENDEKTEAPKGPPVPKSVDDKLKRGREAMQKDASLRRLCMKFWRNQQYWYLNDRGGLSFLPTALFSAGRGKPLHRERKGYNFIHSIVEGKVSAASQRIPGYEVTPSTTDPQDIAASRLAAQIATYGFDKWRLRRASIKTITNALVQREGFAMPYFDPNVGPFYEVLDPETGEVETVGQGEIKVLTLSRSEVMWEPATDFEDSRWHAIERATVIDEVENLPGFYGGKLVPDANISEVPTERKPSENMVVVTEYLERPCPKYPRGRRLLIANGREIVPKEDYPCEDANGEIVDELVLHRLSYTVDPEGDDRGLVEHLIDLARTVNDCWSKLLEWKNRCLMPQMLVPRGANLTRRDDTPGANIEYNVAGGQKPEWERPPAIPNELFQMLDLAIGHMRAIAADVDVQAEPDLAAKTANTAIEQSRQRWQSFLGDLAEWHSRLMRHCLTLVARHYSEQRQVEIRGQYDWATIPDFTGQDLRSQVNVRVLPGSIETKGRQQVMQEIEFIQRNWPNSISPEAAIAILHGGNADDLLKSPQYDLARASRMVRLFQQGLQAVESMPPILREKTVGPIIGQNPDGSLAYAPPGTPDPMTGQPTYAKIMTEVPGWMPRKQDNIPIYKQVVGDYMKTPDYEQLPSETQELFNLFWSGLELSEQERAIERANLEQEMAQKMGMANAAAPQGEIQQPSKPNPANDAVPQ